MEELSYKNHSIHLTEHRTLDSALQRFFKILIALNVYRWSVPTSACIRYLKSAVLPFCLMTQALFLQLRKNEKRQQNCVAIFSGQHPGFRQLLLINDCFSILFAFVWLREKCPLSCHEFFLQYYTGHPVSPQCL